MSGSWRFGAASLVVLAIAHAARYENVAAAEDVDQLSRSINQEIVRRPAKMPVLVTPIQPTYSPAKMGPGYLYWELQPRWTKGELFFWRWDVDSYRSSFFTCGRPAVAMEPASMPVAVPPIKPFYPLVKRDWGGPIFGAMPRGIPENYGMTHWPWDPLPVDTFKNNIVPLGQPVSEMNGAIFPVSMPTHLSIGEDKAMPVAMDDTTSMSDPWKSVGVQFVPKKEEPDPLVLPSGGREFIMISPGPALKFRIWPVKIIDITGKELPTEKWRFPQ